MGKLHIIEYGRRLQKEQRKNEPLNIDLMDIS